MLRLHFQRALLTVPIVKGSIICRCTVSKMLSCVSAVRSAARRVPAAAAAAASPVSLPQVPTAHVASPRSAGINSKYVSLTSSVQYLRLIHCMLVHRVLAAVAAFGIASGAAVHASSHDHDEDEADVPNVVPVRLVRCELLPAIALSYCCSLQAPLDLSSVTPASEVCAAARDELCPPHTVKTRITGGCLWQAKGCVCAGWPRGWQGHAVLQDR